MKVRFVYLAAAVCLLAACNKEGGGGDKNVTSNSSNGSEPYYVRAVNVIEYGGADQVTTVAAVSYVPEDFITEETRALRPRKSPARSASTRSAAGSAQTRAAMTRVGGNVLATAAYVNKGFSFTLNRPPDEVLLDYSTVPDDSPIKVSNKAARTTTIVEVEGHDVNGEYLDDFWFETDNFVIYSQFMYTDRDVSITGTESYTFEGDDLIYSDTYDTHLKKGWNLVYFAEAYEQDTNTSIYVEFTELPAEYNNTLRWDFGFIE